MKPHIVTIGVCALAALAALAQGSARAAVDVGVSIQISEPGVYGRIDIGKFPRPQVVVEQPVVIAGPKRPGPAAQPVYLWVPPGHQKHWDKHCGRYNACGVPVLFVQESWYRQNVMSGSSHPGKGHGKGHDKDHGKGRNKD